MIYIKDFIKQLEEERQNKEHEFEYDLAIHSKTHISLCIITENKSDMVGCFKTKHFLLPINADRKVNIDQITKYLNKLKEMRR